MIADVNGTLHSIEVTADSLYEAIGRALSEIQIQGSGWSAELTQGDVKVAVCPPAVEHTVKLSAFLGWLHRQGGRSPAETLLRQKLRDMLGMPLSRKEKRDRENLRH